ncbi:hypothetical protein [Mesorhizobium sp. M0643]|uniref:hypothetical protein n=1 Tax=Mesorhizobium sp. M0643 TaxID=2956978 RepID=UPI00333A7019
MFERLKAWSRRTFGIYSIKNDAILLYYLSTLDVRARWLRSRGVALDPDEIGLLEELIERRNKLENCPPGTYSEGDAWIEVYRLERLMALLEPFHNLIAEIRLRLDEALAERASAEPRLRAAFILAEANAFDRAKAPPELKASEEPALRALLLEVLEETHWTKNRKFYSRPIQKSATRRIVWAGLFSFVLFLLPYAWIYAHIFMESRETASVEHKFPAELLVGLPFYTALTAGLFGAYFSRLLYIQTTAGSMSVGELKTAKEFTSIFLRGVVGMCGALVVFFFLRSGMVSGKLFPEFAELSVREGAVPLFGAEGIEKGSIRQVLPSQALALLAIWCFLAGFSERLVPSILSSTEQTLGDAARGTKK